MQIFEQKYTTKMAYLYTLQNTIFQRSLFCSLRSQIVAKASAFYVVAQRAGSYYVYSACMPRVPPNAETRRTNAEH